MKIGVCAKVTPDAQARIKIAANGTDIDPAGVKFVVGDYDGYAVEEAIRTKEAHGGEVVSFTVGNATDDKLIRSGALAVGVDRAVLISGDDAVNSGALGTARLLAASIKEAGCDIVFTGKVTTDVGSAQVSSMVAEILGWPQVSQVTEFAIDGTSFTATRNMDGGVRQIVSGSLPVLIACEDGLNTPRYAKLQEIMKAKRKPLDKKTSADVDVGGASVAAGSTTGELAPPPARPAGRIIEGDAAQAAKELVRLLRDEAKVL
jgi:electron transfer flavoprotein beta subunit